MLAQPCSTLHIYTSTHRSLCCIAHRTASLFIRPLPPRAAGSVGGLRFMHIYACCKRVEEASVLTENGSESGAGSMMRHSGGAPCGKATQAYHDKRASVCGYGSRSTPCSCAVDLHVLLYLVVRCSVRARWEGGRGFAVSPPKGGWRGGRTFAVQKSLNGNTCFQMEFWSRHIHIYSHNKHKK